MSRKGTEERRWLLEHTRKAEIVAPGFAFNHSIFCDGFVVLQYVYAKNAPQTGFGAVAGGDGAPERVCGIPLYRLPAGVCGHTIKQAGGGTRPTEPLRYSRRGDCGGIGECPTGENVYRPIGGVFGNARIGAQPSQEPVAVTCRSNDHSWLLFTASRTRQVRWTGREGSFEKCRIV